MNNTYSPPMQIIPAGKLAENAKFQITLKSKTFGRKTFGRFLGISAKKLLDKHDIKNKHHTKLYVENNCDSIMNINLQ